jgi:hypothetical protein
MLNDTVTYEYSQVDRIIIIGDVHGDIKRFKKVLIDAKIINSDLEWVAEPADTIVVQLGDQVDIANRVPDANNWEVLDDTQMLYFTTSLDNIARAKGGRMISLIGNHELMNIIGNFSYVSPNSTFTDRAKCFAPKGSLSGILANRPLVLKIGQLFFCHAGIRKHHIDILEAHNKPVSYINDLWYQFMSTAQIGIEDKDIFDKVILDSNEGILWTRTMDNEADAEIVMKKIGCQYIFIGHNTVDKVQLIQNRLWFMDTGMSRSFGNTSYQYIDIHKYSISVKTITDN